MALKLYMLDRSPPVRAVLMTAKALGISLQQINIDFTKNEHLTPEYLKLNPQHTVPTLEDNGTVLWDSHAINIYLVSKYGKDDSLYPEDPHKRAVINQRLFFDSGVMYPSRKVVTTHIFKNPQSSIPSEKVEGVIGAYAFLEKFLEGYRWMAGNSLTLADLNLIPTVTFSAVVIPIDEKKFPNLTGWITRAKSLPFYNINQEGVDSHKKFIFGYL